MLEKNYQLFHQSLAFLLSQLQTDGAFLAYYSTDQEDFTTSATYHSVFSTSLIACSLAELTEDPIAAQILQKTTTFLLNQKSDYWSFNYWQKDSPEAIKMPYPDDMDDTSCALSALYLTRPELFTGEVLAQIVSMLTIAERSAGGPYYTWLVPADAPAIWHDIDIVVNSNIAYFLSLLEIELPQLNDYIDDHVQGCIFDSPYYPHIFPAAYFLSRFYKGKNKRSLIECILQKQNKKGYWSNPSQTALAILTLLNLNYPKNKLQQAINYLESSHQNGHWDVYAFYIGANPVKNKTHYSGSEALTTTFCLQALHRFYHQPQTEIDSTPLVEEVRQSVVQGFHQTEMMQTLINQMTEQMLQKDQSHQITLLPWHCSQAMAKQLDQQTLIQLGAASLYGWIAYTIYDDIIDDQKNIHLLPVANLCLIELDAIYRTIMKDHPDFLQLYKKTISNLELANFNEMQINKSKYPVFTGYDHLAHKSLGHALSCLAIFYLNGIKQNDKQFKLLVSFFENYLIAKQIHDDAHDWEDDFAKGQQTPITLQLGYSKNIDTLRKKFWIKLLPKVCADAQSYLQKATKAIEGNKALKDKSFFLNLIQKLESSLSVAQEEQNKTIQFIKKYNNPHK